MAFTKVFSGSLFLSGLFFWSLLFIGTSASPAYVPSPISWGECPDLVDSAPYKECGTLAVPIDWDAPYLGHFPLSVSRIRAKGIKKTGSLFLDFTTPGDNQMDWFHGDLRIFGVEMLDAFDFILVSPRGLSFDYNITCDPKLLEEANLRHASPFKNQSDFNRKVQINARLAQSCREASGPLFEHLDYVRYVGPFEELHLTQYLISYSRAKDFEAVRIALDPNEPFNYFGILSNNVAAMAYAELFPNHIRTMVFDTPFPPSLSEEEAHAMASTTGERIFKNWAIWAGVHFKPFQNMDVGALWIELVDKANKSPIPTPNCHHSSCKNGVDGYSLILMAQTYLLHPSKNRQGTTWASLAEHTWNAYRGDASDFANTLWDGGRGLNWGANLGFACRTFRTISNGISASRDQESYRISWPYLRGIGGQTWVDDHCVGWPLPTQHPKKKFNIRTKNPIMLAAVDRAAKTDDWARILRKEIPNSVLVTQVGETWLTFFTKGEAWSVMLRYLLTAEPPKEDFVYPAID